MKQLTPEHHLLTLCTSYSLPLLFRDASSPHCTYEYIPTSALQLPRQTLHSNLSYWLLGDTHHLHYPHLLHLHTHPPLLEQYVVECALGLK